MDILFASNNAHKLKEVRHILADFHILSPVELGVRLDVIEDGTTFEENARKKAMAFSKLTGRAAMADDSGLCVDALGGRPGVISARYAGKNASDRENNRTLLEKLCGQENRAAKFVCVLVLVKDEKTAALTRGECPGRIAWKPRGENGFGYDPLFIPDGFDVTFSEMPSGVKDQLSHRYRALVAMKNYLDVRL